MSVFGVRGFTLSISLLSNFHFKPFLLPLNTNVSPFPGILKVLLHHIDYDLETWPLDGATLQTIRDTQALAEAVSDKALPYVEATDPQYYQRKLLYVLRVNMLYRYTMYKKKSQAGNEAQTINPTIKQSKRTRARTHTHTHTHTESQAHHILHQ